MIGFAGKIVDKHILTQPRKTKVSGVSEKILFINLVFIGDLADSKELTAKKNS